MEGDGEKEYKMTVYRIGDKRLISHMQQQYTVFAAHEDLIKSQKTRVRRSFNNKKPDQIVQQLISEELGGAVDAPKPADNNLSLIVPNWTPFNAASWMCKVATYNNAADYCFFMADDGKYSFKSFEEMFSSDDEKKDLTFYQKPASIREGGDYPDDFTVQVLRYNWEHFDGASAQSSGMYSSTTVSFDLIGKKWEKKVFTFGEDTPADAEGKNFEDVMGGRKRIFLSRPSTRKCSRPQASSITPINGSDRENLPSRKWIWKSWSFKSRAQRNRGNGLERTFRSTCRRKPTWRTKNSTSTGRGGS
jgi:hypothetical protein